MPRDTVRLEGVDNAVRRLEDIKRRTLGRTKRQALEKSGEIVRDRAAARAPVYKGKLKGGMVSEWVPRKAYVVVGPNKDAYYGYWVEKGTSKMAAKPFLRPALDESIPEVSKIIGDAFRKEMERPA